MTTQQHPFRYVNDPAARARLMDPEQVRAAYAQHTLREAGRSLGASQKTFERALDWHGIPRRKRGQKPPGTVITRDVVAAATQRAYARVGRCPPGCKGAMTCLNEDGECVG